MPFYHNTATGTKTWELPSGVNATLQRGKRAAPVPATKEPDAAGAAVATLSVTVLWR